MSRQIAMVDLDAEAYKNNSDVQTSLAMDAIRRLQLKGGETILDIGCGEGKITAHLSRLVPEGRVEGIDQSRSMIHLAQETFSEYEYPNLSFGVMKAEALDARRQYDVIVSFNSLHWIEDQQAIFRKIHNALKDNGQALILTYPKDSVYYHLLEEAVYQMRWEEYAPESACPHWLNKEEYIQAIKDSHLTPMNVETGQDIVSFENIDAYKEYVKGWLPCLIPLTPKLQLQFLDDLINVVARMGLISEDGKLHIPYQKIIIYCWREGARV